MSDIAGYCEVEVILEFVGRGRTCEWFLIEVLCLRRHHFILDFFVSIFFLISLGWSLVGFVGREKKVFRVDEARGEQQSKLLSRRSYSCG